MSSPEAKNVEKMSRRRMLRSAILFSAVGAAVLLGVDSLARAAPSSASGGGPTKGPSQASSSGGPSAPGVGSTSEASSLPSTSAPPAASSSSDSSASGASLRVKAMYFQMPLAVNTEEEYVVLQSPAYLRDLLSNVVEEHPLLSPMIPTMMILIDGVPGQPGTPLKDGDEVDFIPAIAGG